MFLYYHGKKHLSLPEIQIGRPIKKVIDRCIDTVYRKMKNGIYTNISDII